MKLRRLKESDISLTIEAEPEDIAPEFYLSFKNTGFDHTDTIRHIRQRLNLGQQWAWCCVNVTARYELWTGTAYLGCCSYKNKTDFIANSGYYKQMVQEALDDLNKDIRNVFESISSLIQVTEESSK